MKILITGATGFLGKYLVNLLASKDHHVIVLSRNIESKKLFSHLDNVEIYLGDITNFEVLKKNPAKSRVDLLQNIDIVIHAAALYDLNSSYKDAFLHNVVGTQNVLSMLKEITNLKAFYFISTIAVGDPETFFLDEDSLPKRQHYQDAYSETKYIAEELVRNSLSQTYKTRIFRPGIIIGDSQTGEITKRDGPYIFLDTFKKYRHYLGLLPFTVLSYNPRTKLHLIPVDHCAQAICSIIENDSLKEEMKSYHLISEDCPTLLEFLKDVNSFYKIKTHYLPVKKNRLLSVALKYLGITPQVLPFMFSRLSFDRTNALCDAPLLKESSYKTFMPILFKEDILALEKL